MVKYQPQEFEKKWAEEWVEKKIYKTPPPAKKHKKQFIFPMFPYPSGAGLHVGHVRVYTGTDVVARFHRMNGYAVLHPMGWDAFGLPAENAAIKAKKNPMDMVPDHIATFRRQMKALGFSYDWEREFSTTDPQYYKWTQWLFLQFYKMGLLYKKNTPINFCPSCKTGLAEEEVLSDGTHERCGTKIAKKELPQWLFRITKYADRLLEDLKGLDWPRGILEMQKNWIGKEKGLSIKFQIPNSKFQNKSQEITVWTKFWETVFGTTFLVVAPEHPFVNEILNPKSKIQNSKLEEIKRYVTKSLSKTDEQRAIQEKDKTGVFSGCYAVNPVNNRQVPVWIADYVLSTVGTGAVMGVPAHDERDFIFAKKYNLPIVQVVSYQDKTIDEKVAEGEMSYKGEGRLVNSGQFNGMSAWGEGKEKMAKWMIEKNYARWQIHYHLRDWIFSRQRYWGEPIPMVFCQRCAKNQIQNSKFKIQNEMAGWFPVPEDQLPIKLPYVKSYQPTGTGESPLAKITDWVNTSCPNCGGPAKRETDTMPNWAGSCWYFIAFALFNNNSSSKKFLSRDQLASRLSAGPVATRSSSETEGSLRRFLAQTTDSRKNFLDSSASINNWQLAINNFGNRWLPTDWYIGGAEHAVLHLLYARFWVKALYDFKLLDFKEPFTRLRNLGMILAEDHRKMSKSLGNVVNPDDVQKEYGADALRVYEMFMAPFDQEVAWSTAALQGACRFLKRVWEIYQKFKVQSSKFKVEGDKQLAARLQKTILKVTRDITDVKFNTAIAAMMEFVNVWEKSLKGNGGEVRIGKRRTLDDTDLVTEKRLTLLREHAKDFLKILAPFAPFITEEIWREVFGEKQSIHLSSWPKVEEEMVEEEVVIPVQVNGRLRATIKVHRSQFTVQGEVEKLALKEEKVKKYLIGKKYKVIYVPVKILNFVTE